MDFNGMDDKKLLELYQQNKTGRQTKTAPAAAALDQGQPQDIAGLLTKINPILGNTVRGAAQGAAKAFGGISPESDLETQYKQAQIQALQKKGTGGGGYFYMDSEGNVHSVVGAPAGAKPLPAGTTPAGQEQKVAQTNVSKEKVPLIQAQTETANTGNKIMNQYLDGDPTDQNSGGVKNLPPGTTIDAGPMKIPLNPALTEGEASRVSALPTMNKLTGEIKQIVSSPDYMKGNSIQHAIRGMGVDNTKMPWLTFGDKNASNLQSKLANLKTTFFSEGGKNLTKNEIDILSPLLDISGKTPQRIVQDYDTFMGKYNEFLKAKQGGLMGYKSGAPAAGVTDYSQMSDEDLHKIAAGGQ